MFASFGPCSGTGSLAAAAAKWLTSSASAWMDLTRGRSWEAFDRTIDAQVARLRKKIETDPKKPMLIKSVRNVGYVFTGKIDR